MDDVIVSGAGPAGSLAARLCAQSGLDTVLLESSALPRPKCCAGGLLGRAMREMGCEIPARLVQSEMCGFTVNLSGTRYTYRFERTAGITVMREELDFHLTSLAVDSGANLYQSVEVLDIEQDGQGVRVTTSEGSFRSKNLIIAEGAKSRSATRIFGPRTASELATGSIIECEGAQDAGGLVHFHPWLKCRTGSASAACFPKRGGRITVSLFSRGVRRDDLLVLAAGILESNGLTSLGPIQERATFHPIPIKPRPRFRKGNVLLVGDAAGMASAFSGEGLTNAFKSAKLAASAVTASVNDGHSDSMAGYDAAMREIVSRLRRSSEMGPVIIDWLRGPSGERILRNLQTEKVLIEGCGDFVRGDIDLSGLTRIALPRLPRLLRRY